MLGVATNVRQFLEHAESLIESPLVCYIDIDDHAVGRDDIAALARSPHLARVTYLDLAGWYCHDAETDLVDDEQAELLVPHLSQRTRNSEPSLQRSRRRRCEGDCRVAATGPAPPTGPAG